MSKHKRWTWLLAICSVSIACASGDDRTVEMGSPITGGSGPGGSTGASANGSGDAGSSDAGSDHGGTGSDGGTQGNGGTGSASGTGGSTGSSSANGSGNTGGTGGTGQSGGTGNTGTTGGGGSNVSKCGAPLDTSAPTAASIVKNGPLMVSSYSSGLQTSSAYKSLTVFYPSNGTGPYVVVMISPGLTEILQYLQGWAQRFASYGYVAVFVEANNTGSDSAQLRANGMWEAIAALKKENTRAGSPLMGKLSDCYVTSGHSLGGGASLLTANAHPTDIKAAIGFNPYEGTTKFTSIVAPTLILAGQSDTTANPSSHGRRQYDSMSANVTKEYVEIAGGNHQSALSPSSIPGQYAVSWIKLTVDGDERYRPFLSKAANGLSDFATTLP